MSPEEARLRTEIERQGGKICRCVGFGSHRFPEAPAGRVWVGYRAFHADPDCARCGGEGVRFPEIEKGERRQ